MFSLLRYVAYLQDSHVHWPVSTRIITNYYKQFNQTLGNVDISGSKNTLFQIVGLLSVTLYYA